MEDNDLMEQVKHGDLEKLGMLFEKYHRILYSFFYHLSKDQEVSEDLVQNTFIRILKYRKSFKGQGQFKTWMFHIARNIHADHYKKSKKNESVSFSELDEIKVAETMEMPGEKDYKYRILEKAMERLDIEKREILLLSKYQGHKYKAIGQQLNCTEGAVKVKVFRALQALKEEYTLLLAAYN